MVENHNFDNTIFRGKTSMNNYLEIAKGALSLGMFLIEAIKPWILEKAPELSSEQIQIEINQMLANVRDKNSLEWKKLDELINK